MLCVPALKAGLNMCNSAQKHAHSHAQPESRPPASYSTRSFVARQPIKIDPFKTVLQRALHMFNLAVKDVLTLKNQQVPWNKNCLIPRSFISWQTKSSGYRRFLVRLKGSTEVRPWSRTYDRLYQITVESSNTEALNDKSHDLPTPLWVSFKQSYSRSSKRS